jgi:hypothetical protein
MQVDLKLGGDRVEVIFTNPSSTDIRFWDYHISDGCWSISFQIKGESETEFTTIMRQWDVAYTVQGPLNSIGPGESHVLAISLNDGRWARHKTIFRLGDKPLYVRVNYKVDPTPEAAKYQVFVGSVMSDWVLSLPPHDWLLAEKSYRGHTAEDLMNLSPDEAFKSVAYWINSRARNIAQDAAEINENQIVTSIAMDNILPGVTVGHVINNILEFAEDIHKVVGEIYSYLETKSLPQTDGKKDNKDLDGS